MKPSWACPPKQGSSWNLEEIKNGVIISTHSLNRSCTLFGRAEDEVDIPTAHASCSRVHARIAFDTDGKPWLKDLGSGNGTIVNKKPLPKEMTGKDETVRGAVVYPGDVMQFGASTRIFCLIGPIEYERGVTEMPPPPKPEPSESIADAGVSWGIDTDDYEEGGGELSFEHLPIESMQVPPKNRKSYDRLMSKWYKLKNIQTESERIENKAMEGLTAGQTSQLERNRRKAAVLEEEITDLYRELQTEIKGGNTDSSSLQRKKKKRMEEEDDDIDDFYDKTKKPKTSPQTETQETLAKKWTELLSDSQRHRTLVQKARSDLQKLEDRIKFLEDDNEDKFFLENDIQLARDKVSLAKSHLETTEKDLLGVEKLLRVVNPKIVIDREIGLL